VILLSGKTSKPHWFFHPSGEMFITFGGLTDSRRASAHLLYSPSNALDLFVGGVRPMSLGNGTCPHCGTHNHVFRGVEASQVIERDERPDIDEDPETSSDCTVSWCCWRCGHSFTTSAVLARPAL